MKLFFLQQAKEQSQEQKHKNRSQVKHGHLSDTNNNEAGAHHKPMSMNKLPMPEALVNKNKNEKTPPPPPTPPAPPKNEEPDNGKPKKQGKRLYIIIGIVLAVLLAGGGAFFYFTQQSPSDKPAPTDVPNNSNEPTLRDVNTLEAGDETRKMLEEAVQNVDQIEGIIYNGPVETENVTGWTPIAYAKLARFTTDTYILDTFANPYFVADWWTKKDDASVNAINKYLKPTLTSSYYDALIKEYNEANNIAAVQNITFTLPDGRTVTNECFEDWKDIDCFEPRGGPVEIINSNVVLNGETNEVTVTQTFTTSTLSPQLEVPESVDFLRQTFEYTFVLDIPETLPKDYLTTTDPLMKIKSISGGRIDHAVEPYIVSQ